MFWLSIALMFIMTEIIATIIYLYRLHYNIDKQEPNEMLKLDELRDKIKILEDQISNIKVAQSIRRRDNG